MLADFLACPLWVRILAALGALLTFALVGPFFLPRMWRRPPHHVSPHHAVDRLGKLVDDETRARLHQRMHSAR